MSQPETPDTNATSNTSNVNVPIHTTMSAPLSDEFERFERLTRKLVAVPKRELDEAKKAKKA